MDQADSKERNFEWSYTQEPHATRRKQILDKYPGVKEYFGIDQSFRFVVLAMAFFQVFMAYLLRDSSWALICMQTYVVSGTISHSLALAVHECSHNLGFGHNKILLNRILGFLANLPMCLPMSITFKKYHMEHHRNLGENVIDTDVPTEFEARHFVGPLGKCAWLILQPLFLAFRPFIIYKKSITDFEILNGLIQVAFNLLVIFLMGWRSFAYLFGGFIVGLGLHPLSAHFLSDHYMFKLGQETNSTASSWDFHCLFMGLYVCWPPSYYGALNLVTFNVGYHVEHHDFPYVTGRNLPKITKMAPEFYDGLSIHGSWLKLMFDFIFDPRLSLRSRVKRQLCSPSMVQFYGAGGAYASSHVHQFLASMFNSPKEQQE